MINNAGIFSEKHSRLGIKEVTSEQMISAFETNALGALLEIQYFQDNLLQSNYLRVITLSSQMDSLASVKGFCYSYRMSKVAFNMLTKCYANEYNKIITIALRPGLVKTEMGGVNATINAEHSVEKMIQLIHLLTIADSGKFFDIEKNLCDW